MQATRFLVSIALLAATMGTPLLAADRDQQPERPQATDMRAADGLKRGMQAVTHNAAADAPGYGWRYFSDPTARRAVVISPQQDYYYSRGKGLLWVAAEQSGS